MENLDMALTPHGAIHSPLHHGLVGSNHALQVVVAAESFCDIRTWDGEVRKRWEGMQRALTVEKTCPSMGEISKIGKVLLMFVCLFQI